MKKITSILLLLLSLQTIQAQKIFSKERVINRENHDKRKFRWGYYLGGNNFDYDFEYTADRSNTDLPNQDIQIKENIGFNVGLIGNVRINDYLDLRTEPGVFFNTRILTFPNIAEEDNNTRNLETTSVHIPLLLKVSTKRFNNFKPFLVGGLSNSINLSSREDSANDNESGTFRVKQHSFNYELGFGIDFFLPYFKFTPSIRGVYSLTNELVADENPNSLYTSFISRMSSRGVFINFTFQ